MSPDSNSHNEPGSGDGTVAAGEAYEAPLADERVTFGSRGSRKNCMSAVTDEPPVCVGETPEDEPASKNMLPVKAFALPTNQISGVCRTTVWEMVCPGPAWSPVASPIPLPPAFEQHVAVSDDSVSVKTMVPVIFTGVPAGRTAELTVIVSKNCKSRVLESAVCRKLIQ